ncbi:MAG: hypothetical protein JWM34_4689 [Ilumatobacteraceae bacterium]|nr:hypothetical protein [Ilumatobacteraceae bacterium]
MSETYDSLADRLDAIAEEIADAALSDLKSAVRRGDAKRSSTERSLTQARRAVEKAAHLLRSIGDPTEPDESPDDD